jgi:hypothetical protein
MGFRASALEEEFQTFFTLDIVFVDNAVIRLCRTLTDILSLRGELTQCSDKVIRDRASRGNALIVVRWVS